MFLQEGSASCHAHRACSGWGAFSPAGVSSWPVYTQSTQHSIAKDKVICGMEWALRRDHVYRGIPVEWTGAGPRSPRHHHHAQLASKKANSTLALSALMMHCIFLMGYQTGILPRRAPGVRLGGDVANMREEFRVSFESLSRRKYARSTMPSRGFAMVSSTSSDTYRIFLKRNTAFHQRPNISTSCSTSCATLTWCRANLKSNPQLNFRTFLSKNFPNLRVNYQIS